MLPEKKKIKLVSISSTQFVGNNSYGKLYNFHFRRFPCSASNAYLAVRHKELLLELHPLSFKLTTHLYIYAISQICTVCSGVLSHSKWENLTILPSSTYFHGKVTAKNFKNQKTKSSDNEESGTAICHSYTCYLQVKKRLVPFPHNLSSSYGSNKFVSSDNPCSCFLTSCFTAVAVPAAQASGSTGRPIRMVIRIVT